MNDWYLDPPEYPDGPNCPECGGLGDEVSANIGDNTQSGIVFQCEDCGHQWCEYPEPDIEPDIQMTDEEIEEQESARAEANRLCPHGLEWTECNACMVVGDLAYDAAREGRFRR